MTYDDLKNLRAFFSALKDVGYRSELTLEQIPSFTDNGQTPVDKTQCLKLLRPLLGLILGLKGEDEKTDNALILKYLSNPNNRRLLLGKFTPEEQVAFKLKELLTEELVATEETSGEPSGQQAASSQELPPTTTTAPAAGMGLPAAPSISTPRIRFTPQTPTLGGMEGGTGQGIAATNKIDRLEIERVGAATAKSDRLNAQTATLQTETQSTPLSKPNSAEVSNLRSATPQKLNFSAFRSSAGSAFKNFQNFASPAGPFVKTNLNRVAGSLKNMFGGMANLGGRAGLEAINHGGNFFSNMSSAKSGFAGRFGRNGGGRGFLGRFGSGGGKNSLVANRSKLAIFGIIGFMMLVGIITMTAPSATPGQAAPINNPNNPNTNGLDYTLPLKDQTVQPVDIKAIVQTSFPKAKLEYWDKIVQSSQVAGFNPALALALWIEETHASESTVVRTGGSGVPNSEGNVSLGHLGCAPWQDQTIDESLTCLFKFAAPYTNDQFAQFMAVYSSGPPGNPFANNPNFPGNLKKWYIQLVPSGVGAIVAVAPAPTTATGPQQIAVTSCPIFGGKITCGSSQGAPGIKPCHCTDSYTPRCDPLSRRGKAVDITGPNGSKDNDPIYMPLINGKPLKWYFKGDFDDGYQATLRVFQSEPTAEGVWTIHFVHSKRKIDVLKTGNKFAAIPAFSDGQEITDLTQPVAYTDQHSSDDGVGVHTHVSIGLNIDPWDGAQYGNLQYTHPGWKYADAEMGMCQ